MIKWQEKTLDELGTVNRGKSRHRPRDAAFLYGGQYPFIQTADVKNANFYINSFSQTYSEEGLKQSKLWPKGTLCITIAANIADTAILDIEACFPDSIIGFIADEEVCNVKFIKYYIGSFQKNFKQISQGAAQDNLNLQKLLAFKFRFPNKKVQDKIVKVLSAYDDLIENNLKRIALLEETAEYIYKEWFVNFRFPGYEKFEFVDGIPNGWIKAKVGNYIDFIKGKKPKIVTEISSENSVLYLLVDVLEGENLLYTEDKKVPIAKENEVIMIMDGSRSGTIYKSVYGAIGSTMSIIRVINDELDNEYLYYYLKFNEISIKQNNTGSAIPHANKAFIKDMDILVPKRDIINKFSYYARNISKQVSLLKMQINRLKEARDILIPKLIMGEIEV